MQLSGILHFLVCRRQSALITIEGQWAENYRTISGDLLHERAHNETLREKRGNTIITRGMKVFSYQMGFSGQCDVLEFHRQCGGVTLHGEEGSWMPYPVEYKRGEPKAGDYDAAQLCAQAMCLEEMLCCQIKEGALFYGERKRRLPVEFSEELRETVRLAAQEMHELFERRYTPKSKPSNQCRACSLQDLCLPQLTKRQSVANYLEEAL